MKNIIFKYKNVTTIGDMDNINSRVLAILGTIYYVREVKPEREVIISVDDKTFNENVLELIKDRDGSYEFLLIGNNFNINLLANYKNKRIKEYFVYEEIEELNTIINVCGLAGFKNDDDLYVPYYSDTILIDAIRGLNVKNNLLSIDKIKYENLELIIDLFKDPIKYSFNEGLVSLNKVVETI